MLAPPIKEWKKWDRYNSQLIIQQVEKNVNHIYALNISLSKKEKRHTHVIYLENIQNLSSLVEYVSIQHSIFDVRVSSWRQISIKALVHCWWLGIYFPVVPLDMSSSRQKSLPVYIHHSAQHSAAFIAQHFISRFDERIVHVCFTNDGIFLGTMWITAKLMNIKLTIEETKIYMFKMSYMDTSCFL